MTLQVTVDGTSGSIENEPHSLNFDRVLHYIRLLRAKEWNQLNLHVEPGHILTCHQQVVITTPCAANRVDISHPVRLRRIHWYHIYHWTKAQLHAEDVVLFHLLHEFPDGAPMPVGFFQATSFQTWGWDAPIQQAEAQLDQLAQLRPKSGARTCPDEKLLLWAWHRSYQLVIFVLDVINEGFLQFAMRLTEGIAPKAPHPKADGYGTSPCARNLVLPVIQRYPKRTVAKRLLQLSSCDCSATVGLSCPASLDPLFEILRVFCIESER